MLKKRFLNQMFKHCSQDGSRPPDFHATVLLVVEVYTSKSNPRLFVGASNVVLRRPMDPSQWLLAAKPADVLLGTYRAKPSSAPAPRGAGERVGWAPSGTVFSLWNALLADKVMVKVKDATAETRKLPRRGAHGAIPRSPWPAVIEELRPWAQKSLGNWILHPNPTTWRALWGHTPAEPWHDYSSGQGRQLDSLIYRN